MRKPRRETLATTGLYHKMWHGHDREPVLEAPDDKRRYLDHLSATYTERIREQVEWYSFCLMTNHVHETGRVGTAEEPCSEAGIGALGDWMRNGHSRFGAEYNRRHRRRGKVAYDRPKTTEIENEESVLEVMFYGDANPVRAGMVSHPSKYPHSSHGFYAYGTRSAHTEQLALPAAYLALGPTPQARQKKYRSLCDDYLRRVGLIVDRPDEGTEALPGAGASPPSPASCQQARARGDPTG